MRRPGGTEFPDSKFMSFARGFDSNMYVDLRKRSNYICPQKVYCVQFLTYMNGLSTYLCRLITTSTRERTPVNK